MSPFRLVRVAGTQALPHKPTFSPSPLLTIILANLFLAAPRFKELTSDPRAALVYWNPETLTYVADLSLGGLGVEGWAQLRMPIEFSVQNFGSRG